MTTASEQAHQTAAQRGGQLRDKDKPLSDTQRDRHALLPAFLVAPYAPYLHASGPLAAFR